MEISSGHSNDAYVDSPLLPPPPPPPLPPPIEQEEHRPPTPPPQTPPPPPMSQLPPIPPKDEHAFTRIDPTPQVGLVSHVFAATSMQNSIMPMPLIVMVDQQAMSLPTALPAMHQTIAVTTPIFHSVPAALTPTSLYVDPMQAPPQSMRQIPTVHAEPVQVPNVHSTSEKPDESHKQFMRQKRNQRDQKRNQRDQKHQRPPKARSPPMINMDFIRSQPPPPIPTKPMESSPNINVPPPNLPSINPNVQLPPPTMQNSLPQMPPPIPTNFSVPPVGW